MWKGENAEGKPSYIVQIEYDAQNGFGASLRDCKLVSFFEDEGFVKWAPRAGIMHCASNPSYGGLIDESSLVEITKENNSFK